MNPNFNVQFIFGIVGLLLVTVTYKKFPEFSFGIFALLLLLSIFNVVTFSYAFGVNFGIFSIPSILLFAVLFFTQMEKFFELKRNWSGNDDEDLENKLNSKIQIYKNQFQNLSEGELHRKLENDQLVEDAKIAVVELLHEKSQ